ncbi:MAG: UDP-N-acetylmuramoyl-tripeptide--D-alanyl-D-alanine ligase [Bdellovibrionales bacterium]|nr:UDP-N-acetylmuramoyl-tripeptide--D-alanyl-D-alanine ligase [Bdellovibrionales bacterium]
MNKLALRVDIQFTREILEKYMNPISMGHEILNSTGICLDSRSIQKGDLFFALKAARDGHEFVQNALLKGASGVVVEKPSGASKEIVVHDTLEALHQLARSYRDQWGKTVIGISGSNGKTTTKEIIQVLLGNDAFSTPGTWNNHLGIPLSLFLLRDKHQFAIIEMGINQFGDLKGYCSYAKPDVGVLTVIGQSHLMNLKNQAGVAKAKQELFQALPSNGTAVILLDDPYICEMISSLSCRIVKVSLHKQADVWIRDVQGDLITVAYGDETIRAPFNLKGEHNLSNLVCAMGVAYSLGVSSKVVEQAVPKIQPLEMRMQELSTKDGVSLIVDCYNANPTSTRAGLSMVSALQGRKIAFLGDMLELGVESSKIHMDVGKYLGGCDLDHVFLMGQFAQDYYQGALLGGLRESQLTILDERANALQKIRAHLQRGDILYVKGSRGMKLEELIAPLL